MLICLKIWFHKKRFLASSDCTNNRILLTYYRWHSTGCDILKNIDLFFSFAYIFCGKIVAKKILILVVQNWLKIKSVKVPYLYDISVANYQASKCVGIMWLISMRLTIMFWLHFTIMRARNNQIVSNFQDIDFI